MSLISGEVEWEWRKKTYSRSELRAMPTQFYYVLSTDELGATLAWQCVPVYNNGQKLFPQGSYPCEAIEAQRLNKERRRRLGICETPQKKLEQEAQTKMPF